MLRPTERTRTIQAVRNNNIRYGSHGPNLPFFVAERSSPFRPVHPNSLVTRLLKILCIKYIAACQPVALLISLVNMLMRDFYRENVLRDDAVVTSSSVSVGFSEAINNVPEVILTDHAAGVTSSEVPGAYAAEDRAVLGKSSLIIEQPLPSNQHHFNHELLMELSKICRQLKESLNFHSELTRKMYGCVDTLLTNSAEQDTTLKNMFRVPALVQLCFWLFDVCVGCCGFTEAVIRLVISSLVGVATVAVLIYDFRSRRESTSTSDESK
ncbi:hypothetical protein E1301_Tti019094 [Triplophysa tibetana]|uniref:Uncharacterized protein n=1 Tax=Triplophysa tibetana TaxID=1572043 RepID=A0A5A9NS03_9TELE|nr:hypothetical protein E1301_Tti019094 [Triplophysa tibetana]